MPSPQLTGYGPAVSVSVGGWSSHLYLRPYHHFLQHEDFCRSFWSLYKLLYHLSIAAHACSTPSISPDNLSHYSPCLQSSQGKLRSSPEGYWEIPASMERSVAKKNFAYTRYNCCTSDQYLVFERETLPSSSSRATLQSAIGTIMTLSLDPSSVMKHKSP